MEIIKHILRKQYSFSSDRDSSSDFSSILSPPSPPEGRAAADTSRVHFIAESLHLGRKELRKKDIKEALRRAFRTATAILVSAVVSVNEVDADDPYAAEGTSCSDKYDIHVFIKLAVRIHDVYVHIS